MRFTYFVCAGAYGFGLVSTATLLLHTVHPLWVSIGGWTVVGFGSITTISSLYKVFAWSDARLKA